MKAQIPTIPRGAPPGTIWFGGPITWFSISLRLISEDLIPAQITKLMRCNPDRSQQKGVSILRKDGKVLRTPKMGCWELKLEPKETDEWDCGEAMLLVLRRLPSGIGFWKRLVKKYRVDFFVGLSMPAKNKGFSLSPDFLKYMGDRRISVGFDFYYEGDGKT